MLLCRCLGVSHCKWVIILLLQKKWVISKGHRMPEQTLAVVRVRVPTDVGGRHLAAKSPCNSWTYEWKVIIECPMVLVIHS